MELKSNKIFALVDCNNFYASCERAFNPKIKDKPVVVLSNNDGCAIAMSNEAKALGISIGTPFFKIQNLVKTHDIKVFSSNYTLYGDMSHRVMSILSEFSPHVEIYSIDEAFLSLDRMKIKNFTDYCNDIREKILKCTGIPVSIGIAGTKTLAKLANRCAKKLPGYEGVFDLNNQPFPDSFLEKTMVEDIWGIGRQKSKKLNAYGFYNALDLKNCQDFWVKKNLGGIVGLRTVYELRGYSCLTVEDVQPGKKQIISSRSFGVPVDNFRHMSEAVAFYASRASEKLRRQKSLVSVVSVSIQTNNFKPGDPQYSNSATFQLRIPTNYTPELAHYCIQALKKIYRDGYKYKKAGVLFLDIIPEKNATEDLFCPPQFNERNSMIMETMDKINRKHRSSGLRLAATGGKQEWGMKQDLISRRFTTQWKELLEVS